MSNDGQKEAPAPLCPFFKAPCKGSECILFCQLRQILPGPIAGTSQQQTTTGCVFPILLKLLAEQSRVGPMVGLPMGFKGGG